MWRLLCPRRLACFFRECELAGLHAAPFDRVHQLDEASSCGFGTGLHPHSNYEGRTPLPVSDDVEGHLPPRQTFTTLLDGILHVVWPTDLLAQLAGAETFILNDCFLVHSSFWKHMVTLGSISGLDVPMLGRLATVTSC